MQIRQLTPIDLSQFRAFRLSGLEEWPEAFGESVTDFSGKSDTEVADMLSSHGRGDFVLGCFVDDSLVGAVGFFTHPFEKMAHKGTIWGMYVEPEQRGRGIGRSLLKAAIAKASALPKISQIDLTVVTDSGAANKLYVSEGFEVTGTEKSAMIVNGRQCDWHFMQRHIDDT